MASDHARMLEMARSERLWPRPPLWVAALGAAFAALLLAYPFIFTAQFSHHVMILILLYALMSQSWNVLAGLSGQISLGHAIFFGLGAYSSTVLFAKYGITPWVGLLVGVALSSLAAVAIGVPTLRLRGHYFAIATLLIGTSVQIVFQRWEWVGAASGLYVPLVRTSPVALPAVPRQQGALLLPDAHGGRCAATSWCGSCAAAASASACRRCATSPMRRPASASPLPATRCWRSSSPAAMMSVAGTFYGQYVLVLDPERLFSTDISIIVLLMTVLGGSGTLWGPAVGAAILVPLSEYSRIWFGGTGRTIDLIVYGILITVVCMWRPNGILSIFEERIRRRGGRRT